MTQNGNLLDLPPGRVVELPGRGTVFVRECRRGARSEPAVVLIHGLALTADLNWFGAFGALCERFHVVAPDLRGHGRSTQNGSRFSLEECADDVAALADVLHLDRVICVGYSMGGLIAQLLCRRHPELVAGTVLCATARNFRGTAMERLACLTLPSLAAVAQLAPPAHLVGSSVLGTALLGHVRNPALWRWSFAEMERTSLATAATALHAVSRFTSHEWIGSLQVPAATVITTRDRIVPKGRQLRLAEAIPGAQVHELDGDHGVCVNDPGRFGSTLATACARVSAA